MNDIFESYEQEERPKYQRKSKGFVYLAVLLEWYDEDKSYVFTDGHGFRHSPSDELIDCVALKCEKIYYEKTKSKNIPRAAREEILRKIVEKIVWKFHQLLLGGALRTEE